MQLFDDDNKLVKDCAIDKADPYGGYSEVRLNADDLEQLSQMKPPELFTWVETISGKSFRGSSS